MQFTKFIVCILALVGRICSAGIIVETSKLDESLAEASIDILESCYGDRIGAVGFAGTSIGDIVEKISFRDTVIPVTLIEQTSRVVSQGPVDDASRHKLRVFVITATDPGKLVKTLTQVKSSKWWNHMASFLLIDSADVEDGCSNAHKMLREAWKMDLLNSKFLCLHRTHGRLIYTFNPYTSKAPGPWQQENTYKGINDHVWTLFVRQYREDASRCDGLDFDKTLDLGGYELRASTSKNMDVGSEADPDVKPMLFDRVHNLTAHILINFLGATWKFRVYPDDYGSRLDKSSNVVAVAAEVGNGTSDIGFNLVPRYDWTDYKMTHELFRGSIAIITQYSGDKSQLDKIFSVLDRGSRFGVVVALLITVLFFKYCQRKPLIPAMMDLLLIICNAPLLKMPKKSAQRIYLASIFVCLVTVNGIYQGQLASLLTKQERLPAVNSIEDLARSDHKIYGLKDHRYFLGKLTFERRYFGLSKLNCTGYVLLNPKAACVSGQFGLIEDALKFNLHVSRESIGTLRMGYLMRPDWPLEDRVNEIYMRAIESDIIRSRYTRELDRKINRLKAYENRDQDHTPKVLTLRQLSFAFLILAFGLAGATIAFITEVAIFHTAVAKHRIRNRRRILFFK